MMKRFATFLAFLFCAIAAVVVLVAASAPRYNSTADSSVRNSSDTPGLKIYKTGTQTGNSIEVWYGGTLAFRVPVGGLIKASTAQGRIESGSVITAADATVTNTFITAFSAAPIVVVQQIGNACTVTNALTVTTSNFVFGAGAPSIVAKFIAVGAP